MDKVKVALIGAGSMANAVHYLSVLYSAGVPNI